MKKVLFIVGSLREGSFNKQLAKMAEKALDGKAEVAYLDWSKVPVFSQDLETPELPILKEVRAQVLEADALWFFSPAYNEMIPGPLKNLIDWLSRATDLSDTTGASVLQDKLVSVSSVATRNYPDMVLDQLKQLLTFVRTQTVEPFTRANINPEAWGDGVLVVDDVVLTSLQNQADALMAAMQ